MTKDGIKYEDIIHVDVPIDAGELRLRVPDGGNLEYFEIFLNSRIVLIYVDKPGLEPYKVYISNEIAPDYYSTFQHVGSYLFGFDRDYHENTMSIGVFKQVPES